MEFVLTHAISVDWYAAQNTTVTRRRLACKKRTTTRTRVFLRNVGGAHLIAHRDLGPRPVYVALSMLPAPCAVRRTPELWPVMSTRIKRSRCHLLTSCRRVGGRHDMPPPLQVDNIFAFIRQVAPIPACWLFETSAKS